LTGSHLELAIEGRKLAYTVRFTSNKAVAGRRRQSHCRKWCHVTSGDRKWPGSDVIDRKSPGSGCGRPETCVYCAFHFLQGCNSKQEALTWQERTSRDRRWRYLTGSHLELAVEGPKLAYTVRFTSNKAMAGRRRKSR